jgi:hypothetical protein
MATNLRQREICQGAPPSAGDIQKKGRLTIQCDELWSFVDNKGNKQWVWLALDANTRGLWGFTSGHGMKRLLANYGNRCLPSIANVRLLTLILGQPMPQCSRLSVIERWVKKLARLATSSDSTTRCGNGYLDLCEKPCPSRSR